MYTKILYMVTVGYLMAELENLIAKGAEITCVTNLREFYTPNMDGVTVTDYLIIYK